MIKKTLALLLAALFLLSPFQALGVTQQDWDMSCRYKTSRDAAVYDRAMYGTSFYYTSKLTLPAGTYINVISSETNGKRMIVYCLNGQETMGWIDSDAYTSAVKTITAPDGTVYTLPESAWGNQDAVTRFLAQYYPEDQVRYVLELMNAEIAASSPAEAASWTCPVCGKTGNTDYFCPRCGTPGSIVNPGGTVSPTAFVTAAPSVTVGDLLLIGGYGGDELLWQVLAVLKGKALLLSRYGIERSCFNTNNAGQTWSNSTVRKWLNGTFYSQAFSRGEAAAIIEAFVNEAEDQASKSFAPKRIGESTYDHVFLLSYAELMTYVPNTRDRQCVPTNHALSEGCNYSDTVYLNGQPTCWWWLRSPAYRNNALAVNTSGVVEACMMSQSYGALRPAMWVDLQTLQQNGELSFGTANKGASYIPSGTANPNFRIATQNTPTPTPGVLTPTPGPTRSPTRAPTLTPSSVGKEVCRAFIQSGGYLTNSGGAVFSKQEDLGFALHDLDLDGVPELLIHNGYTGTGKAAVYAYAFQGSTCRFLGRSGKGDCLLFFYPGTPGVLCSNTANGVYALDRYTLQNGNIVENRVMETVYTDTTYSVVRSTWQDEAFFKSVSGAGVSIDPWPLKTVSSLGWDAFFAAWQN